MTDVKCKVSRHYWGHGDICQADSIMVDCNNRRRLEWKLVPWM